MVHIDSQVGGIKICCQSFVGDGSGIAKAIEMIVGKNEIAEMDALRGTEAECLAEFGKRLVELPESLENDAKIVRRHLLARIDLSPELIHLARFLHIAGDEVMVVRLDVELLPFTDVSAQIVGFLGIFRREDIFAEVVIGSTQNGISHSEMGIKLDGTLEQGHGGGVVTLSHQSFSPQAVGLERFERGRGGLFNWGIQFLDGLERLSELFTQLSGSCAKSLQDIFFASGRDLLLGQVIAGLTIHGADSDDVVAAHAGNGTTQIRLASGALAKVAGNSR